MGFKKQAIVDEFLPRRWGNDCLLKAQNRFSGCSMEFSLLFV